MKHPSYKTQKSTFSQNSNHRPSIVYLSEPANNLNYSITLLQKEVNNGEFIIMSNGVQITGRCVDVTLCVEVELGWRWRWGRRWGWRWGGGLGEGGVRVKVVVCVKVEVGWVDVGVRMEVGVRVEVEDYERLG